MSSQAQNDREKNTEQVKKTDKTDQDNAKTNGTDRLDEKATYWRQRYEDLERDHQRLQTLNSKLEDKLLNIVGRFEKQRDDLVAQNELEKNTLINDVNKLSNKLVDARMKLLDYEEHELVLRSERLELSSKVKGNDNTNNGTPLGMKSSLKTLGDHASAIGQVDHDPNLV